MCVYVCTSLPRSDGEGDRQKMETAAPFAFVVGSISSFSTLEIFREASHLRGSLCPPNLLLSRFRSLRHVQGSTPRGVFEGGCVSTINTFQSLPFYLRGLLESPLTRQNVSNDTCTIHLSLSVKRRARLAWLIIYEARKGR